MINLGLGDSSGRMNLMVAHILRGLQLLFAIIVLGTAAAAVDMLRGASRDSFMVFNAVWTIFVVFYFMLTPRFLPVAAHKMAFFALDALTMIFWFAGFIALAVEVNRVGSYPAGFDYNDFLHKWYQLGVAATVFGAFEWLLFVATTVLNALIAFNRGSTDKTEAPNPNPELSTV